MKDAQTPLVREYLEVLVTRATKFDDLIVPAGTRLLGLPAPADAQSQPGSVSLVVPDGSVWLFDAAACEVTPKKLKSRAGHLSSSARPMLSRDLTVRQLKLARAVISQVQADDTLSREARVSMLYQALAQTAALELWEPGMGHEVDRFGAESEIVFLLNTILGEAPILKGQARSFLEPLALWAAASEQDILKHFTERCSHCDFFNSSRPRACTAYALRAQEINKLYANALLRLERPDIPAMKRQAKRLTRIDARLRVDGAAKDIFWAARMELLTTLADLQFASRQPEASRATMEVVMALEAELALMEAEAPVEASQAPGAAGQPDWNSHAVLFGLEGDGADSEILLMRPEPAPVVEVTLWADSPAEATEAVGFLQKRLGRRIFRVGNVQPAPGSGPGGTHPATRWVLRCPPDAVVRLTFSDRAPGDAEAAIICLKDRLGDSLSIVRSVRPAHGGGVDGAQYAVRLALVCSLPGEP